MISRYSGETAPYPVGSSYKAIGVEYWADRPRSKSKLHRTMSTSEKDDPVFSALQLQVKKSYGPCLCYCYPISPVYIPLPKPIEELDGIYIHAVFPKKLHFTHWEFTKKGDMDSVWANMSLHQYRRDLTVKVADVKQGKHDDYTWHNSDVGDVSPVFDLGTEHFIQLFYDKATGDLVTKVNGDFYNRHPMEDGKTADEFVVYGNIMLPEVAIPFSEFKLPFEVDLNGSVHYADQYQIEFTPLPKAKTMTVSLGDTKFVVDFEKYSDKQSKYPHDRVMVYSHCNCAFFSFNDEVLRQVYRRLPASHMIIDGDIEVHRIVITKS